MEIVLLESLGVSEETLAGLVKPLLAAGHTFKAFDRSEDTKVLIEEAKDADVIMLANMPLSGEVIRACKNLKFINIAFTGVDHVDIAAAKECGVAVSNAAGYSTEAVAELSIGQMLSLLRNVKQTEERCREGGTKAGLVGKELSACTVGIVGIGAIGQRTAALAKAFGSRVIGTARNPRKEAEAVLEFVSFEELLKTADIISLHCPLNDSTRGLIGKDQLAMMKKSAYLVNMARGPVVDSAALADALNEGRIAGAAIDVFEIEPPLNTDHPLLHAKNCLVTPHIAFASEQSMILRAQIIFDSLNAFMAGEQKNVVYKP